MTLEVDVRVLNIQVTFNVNKGLSKIGWLWEVDRAWISGTQILLSASKRDGQLVTSSQD